MEHDLREFMSAVADTDVKKELLLYFHGNPALDSPQGLAMWINRSADEIAAEIDALVDAQILQRSGSGKNAIYMYGPSPEQSVRVEQFVAFYKSDRRAAEDEMQTLRRSLADLAASSLREIQREQSKTKTILASMVDGVLVTDANQTIVLYNPAAARILGIEGGIALGKSLRECGADASVRRLAEHAAELLQSNLTMIALEVQVQQPRELFLKAHLSTVRDENHAPVGVVAVLRDITDLKLADEQRVAFVHMMAHELRSPLTSIKGFVQSILRGVFGGVVAEQKEPLDIVMQQSDRLLSLINDLLEMARLEAGTKAMKMEPLALTPLLEKIARVFTPQAAEKNHSVQLDLPDDLPMIEADEDAMEHVFTNLLSNAIKYTLPGGTVNVRAEDHVEHVVVAVSDSGIGIPPEARAKLFSRFFRVKDPRMREVTGTGLGLSIVKNYVESQMGTIDVTSQVDVGTTFVVTMPKHTTTRKKSEVESAIERAETVHELRT